MKYRSNQSGVALVITLIMLTVITLIAVAFLLLSQRERSSVSSAITAKGTETMLEAGLDRAKGQILADMAALFVNPTNRVATNAAGHWITRLNLGPDLLVSISDTNYTNAPYLTPGQTAPDRVAIASLLWDPRVPVFVTNRVTGVTNFVFYLDLNRNGRFEPSGFVPLLDNRGIEIPDQFHYAIGDPEWVGVLSRINDFHSGTNRFIGRYAYLIIPAGRTHDIDTIHNDIKGGGLGFGRNQGHGAWELNLGALLADLNTNFWADYRTDFRTNFSGIAFDDAAAILNYRYAAKPLRAPEDVFGLAFDQFIGDGIDQWGDDSDLRPSTWDRRAWPGAQNPQNLFTVHDYFNPKDPTLYATFNTFQTRLTNAAALKDSYNSETFYRMLAQLGTDTAPEKMTYRVRVDSQGKIVGDDGPINLNYANTNGMDATDFVPWTPEGFFHTVADRLLRDHGLGNHENELLSVTNLMVYPTNFYTPSVHRLLQMTLNIFDATTNRGASYPYYPTALKPIFHTPDNGSNVFIRGYQEVPRNYMAVITNAANWRDLSNATDRFKLGAPADHFVYGVPVLIGAKKGYPNFNEYVFQSIAQVHRELNVEKTGPGVPFITNHVFYMGISNYMGLEMWNSYTNPFPRELKIMAGVELSTSLTNDESFSTNFTFSTNNGVVLPPNFWQAGEFLVPLNPPRPPVPFAVDHFLRYSIYQASLRRFLPTNSGAYDAGTFPAPQWVLTTTNRMRFFMFDDGHLVDAVGLAPTVTTINITKALHDLGDPQNPAIAGGTVPHNVFWLTNRVSGNQRDTRNLTAGIRNQLITSQTGQPAWNQQGVFRTSQQWPTVADAARGFSQYLQQIANNSLTNVARTNMWAPFVPQQKVYQQFVWQANDPLVHHLVEDLRFATSSPPRYSTVLAPTFAVTTIGRLNPVYQPWNGNPSQDQEDAGRKTASTDGTIKDPRIEKSNDWDFPTNKFANIGLLGRVHRGTPWQTIYLKGAITTPQAWATSHRGGARSNPTNDWRLADIFTVAAHPNASRGRMSVNQTNVAGWSAVLSGLQIPMVKGGIITNEVIEPALIDPTVDKLVEAINAQRQLAPGQVFSSVAEFLTVPELTVASPFLTPASGTTFAPQSSPKDSDYEALPEKIASLVKPGEPRFVVYVFGQSLKPAPQSVIPGGPFRGLCVNYEVTGEMAAKAVMRVDSTPQPGAPRLRAVIESFNLLPPD
jgi:hypothetical protein